MRRWLEFHDSEFASLVHDDHTAVLELDGYVHLWERIDEGWNGSGWTQRVRITVLHPTVRITEPQAFDPEEDCPDIWEGALHCGSVAYEDLIPLPFSYDGDLRLNVEMNIGRSIQITGDSIRVDPLGDPTFVENLRQDFAPDEDGNCGRWH